MSLDEAVPFHREPGQTHQNESDGRIAKIPAAKKDASIQCERYAVTQRFALSLAILIATVIFIVAFGDPVRELDYDALIDALRHTSTSALAISLCATVVSFAALAIRDLCALRYIGARAPLPAILLASFCGNALGNTVAFGGLTGGAIRYRIYGAVGITADDTARLMIFIALGFGLGLSGIGGFAALARAESISDLLGWPIDFVRACGGTALAAAAGLALISVWGEARLGQFRLPAACKTIVAAQFFVTLIRLTSAAAAL
jgi:phosphatidylglycerol lysyltransferase